MPLVDPDRLQVFTLADGRHQVCILTDTLPYPSDYPYHPHAARRAAAIQEQLNANGRACRQCGQTIPLYRPASARYCGKSCRYKAWYRRRKDARPAVIARAWSEEDREQAQLRLHLGLATVPAARELLKVMTIYDEVHRANMLKNAH